MKPVRLFLAFLILHSTLQITLAQSWLWAKQPVYTKQGTNNPTSEAFSVAADKSGNVYQTGYFSNATMRYGNTNLYSAWNVYFLAKYDSAGHPLWARQGVVQTDYDEIIAQNIAVDPAGNVYVTGFFTDSATFGNITLITPYKYAGLYYLEVYLVKYDPNGNVLWARQSLTNEFNPYPNQGIGLVCDKLGNVYVCGEFGNTMYFGNASVSCIPGGEGDAFLVKYDSNGNVLWAQQPAISSASSFAVANAVTVDAGNNVFVTGNFRDTISFGSQMLINNARGGDVFIAKYDANGNALWAKQAVTNSTQSSFPPSNAGTAMVTDKEGNLYLTGNYADTISFDNNQLINPIPYSRSTPYGDLLLVKYSPDGNVIWAKTAQPIDSVSLAGYSITADTLDRIYLLAGGGNSFNGGHKMINHIKFDNDTFVSSNPVSWEFSLVVELNTAGDIICGSAIPMGGDDAGGIACDPTGNYVFVGQDYNTQLTVYLGGDTINYPAVTYEELPFIARWSPCHPAIPLSVTINKTDVTCHGLCNGTAAANVTSGTAPYTYLWNTQPADTAAAITGLCTGDYSITVTDHTGATTTSEVAILNPQALVSAITATKDTICEGDTTMLFVTGNATSMQWQSSPDGGNYMDITGAVDSTYILKGIQTTTFRVVGGNGSCFDTSSVFTLTVNPLPVPVVATADSLICSGDSTRVCTADTFTSYLWNNEHSSFCTTVDAAGGYWVTVTDANHCSAISGHQEISVYPVPSVSIIEQGDTLSSYGQVSYQWILNGSPVNGATGPLFIARQAGDYTVQVTDTNGCIATSNPVTLTGVQNLTGEDVLLYPNLSISSWQLSVGNELVGSALQVFDEQGRIVFQSTIRNIKSTIDLNVANGIYWLHISNPAINTVKKLIKL